MATPAAIPAAPTVSANKPTPAKESPEIKSDQKQSIVDLIKILLDNQRTVAERAKAAEALAEDGSAEAMAGLKAALGSAPDKVRAAIAEALGKCPNGEATGILVGLLSDKSEAVAKAAAHGLAQQGSPAAIAALSQNLYNAQAPLNVRCESALSMATINKPGVLESLFSAATTIKDDSVVTEILNGLGGRSIDETQGFFQNYLRSPNVDSDLKVTALEALAQAKGDPVPFLLDFAKDQDSDLRAAAAWSISTTENKGTAGQQLTSLLQSETDPDVRRRLYQALGNQDSFDLGTVEAALQKETEAYPRVAGLDMLAARVREEPSADLTAYFDQNAVPDLKDLALNGENPHSRIEAVMALKRAGTPAAMSALQDLAQQATDQRVLASARAAFGGPPARKTKP